MIKTQKIKIFLKYNRDIDSWARDGSKKEHDIMVYADWYLIDSLLQDLFLTIKKVVSEEFSVNLKQKLKESCDSSDTINMLHKIAGKA